MIVVTKRNMPYVKKSTRSRPYKKRYVRRTPTVRSLARKVNKLSSNASRYIDDTTDMSASTTATTNCPQGSIADGDDVNNRDSNNIFTKKIYIDYMAQANDPEGNVGRFLIFCVPDGTVPTLPAGVFSPTSPMTTNCRQYVLMDYKFSMGSFQSQSSSGTSSNSYYPWHRIKKTLVIPKRFQKNFYQVSGGGDHPTNSIWLVFMTDSAVGSCPCYGYSRTYFWA